MVAGKGYLLYAIFCMVSALYPRFVLYLHGCRRAGIMNRVFIIFCGLGYGLQLLGKFHYIVLPTWYVNFAADFFCLPIMLYIALETIKFIKRDTSLKLSILQITGVTLYVGSVFEWLLPYYNTKYTGDKIDLLMYGLGAALFFFWQKTDKRNNQLGSQKP